MLNPVIHRTCEVTEAEPSQENHNWVALAEDLVDENKAVQLGNGIEILFGSDESAGHQLSGCVLAPTTCGA